MTGVFEAERAPLVEARDASAPASFWSTLIERFERGTAALEQYISASDAKKRALLLPLGAGSQTWTLRLRQAGQSGADHRDVENLINRRCIGVGTRYLMNYFGWARRFTQHKPFGNDLLAEMLA